jgi:hypothetical protein
LAGNKDTNYIIQATIGIRLDELARFMEDNGQAVINEVTNVTAARHDGRAWLFDGDQQNGFGDVVEHARQAITAYAHNHVAFQNAVNAGDGTTDALLGLTAIAAVYLRGADAFVSMGTQFVKNLTPLMARTDFATMFSLLPAAQRDYLAANPDDWVGLALAGASMGGDSPDRPLFTPGPLGQLAVEAQPVRQALTRKKWLTAMVGTGAGAKYKPGKDLLTSKNAPVKTLRDEFASLGELGSATDPTGFPTNPKAPIFELRKMKGAPVHQWKELALAIFRYTRGVNLRTRQKFDATAITSAPAMTVP